MTAEERAEFIKRFRANYCDAVMEVKGPDYSGTARGETEDVNANFKRVAKMTGLTPVQVCLVYMSKHWDSVMTWGRTGSSSEPIYGRLGDLANYAQILASLIEEDTPRTIEDGTQKMIDNSGDVSFDEARNEYLLPGCPCVYCQEGKRDDLRAAKYGRVI